MPFSHTISNRTLTVAPAQNVRDWQAARALITEMLEWLGGVVGLDVRAHQHDANAELDSLTDFYRVPEGQMLIACVDGVPCGTTGVRLMDPETAELRRVWVTPAARGNAIAPALLRTGIETARSLGARRVWLETAAGHMDKAIRMYRRAGFRDIPSYSSLPDALPNVLTLGLELD